MSDQPKYSKDQIKGMQDQLLSMNLDSERLPSTGSAAEKRERLMKHFYPTTPNVATGPSSQYAAEQGPNPGPSAKKPNYSKTQINCLPIGPLKVALAALNLPFTGGMGDGRATLKAALYPPSVAVGSGTQPNLSQLPLSQPSGASGSVQYVATSQPNVVTGPVSQPNPSPLPSIQPSGASGSASQPNLSQGREQWHLQGRGGISLSSFI